VLQTDKEILGDADAASLHARDGKERQSKKPIPKNDLTRMPGPEHYMPGACKLETKEEKNTA
jgi:hypothetical protein